MVAWQEEAEGGSCILSNGSTPHGERREKIHDKVKHVPCPFPRTKHSSSKGPFMEAPLQRRAREGEGSQSRRAYVQ